MRFYDLNGQEYCRDCRDGMLQNTDAAMTSMQTGQRVDETDEFVRPRDFQALGERPWTGSEKPYRYIQCDGCMGQWGPDA